MAKKSSRMKSLKQNLLKPKNRLVSVFIKKPLIAGLASLTVLGLVIAYFTLRSSATLEPHQLALMQEDTSKPFVVERVRSGTGYEVVTTSQPFDVIATLQGDMYCKVSENEMGHIVLGKGAMKKLLGSTQKDIDTVRKDEASADESGGGKTLWTHDGKTSKAVTVNKTKKADKFDKLVAKLKTKCTAAKNRVKAKDLPQFGLPKVGETKVAISSLLDSLTVTGSASAATTAPVLDTATEKDQLYRINLNRLSYNRPPALTRMSCIDSVARKWNLWLAAIGEQGFKIAHNPNFGSQIISSCKLINWKIMGENVGVGSSSENLFRAYMGSQGHKDNILNTRFNRIGVAAHRNSNNRLYAMHNFLGL